jgi:hypothetical protein
MRHGTAKAQLEAKTDEGVGLLAAAVEGMGNASGHNNAPQLRQHGIYRSPYVQEYGQIQVAGELQLLAKKVTLQFHGRLGDEIIEPDLTNRDS